jgi:hypothetical protein
MTTKTCRKCAETKSINDFYKAPKNKNADGLRSYCKQCSLISAKQWQKTNRTRCANRERKWRKNNPDKFKKSCISWRNKNKELVCSYTSNRRTKKMRNGIFQIGKNELAKLYSSACVSCGSTQEITLDHIIPISRGGRHAIGNLQPMCQRCNSSKGDKLMVEWRMRRSA